MAAREKKDCNPAFLKPCKSGEIEVSMYVYHWDCADEPYVSGNQNIIRAYGITKENKNVYIKIENFSTYCYVELPIVVNGKVYKWTDEKASLLHEKLLRNAKCCTSRGFIFKKKLYYLHKVRDPKYNPDLPPGPENLKYKDKSFPFLFYAFSNTKAMHGFKYQFKNEVSFDGKKMKLNLHEHEISPLIKLFAQCGILSAGWLKVRGKLLSDDHKNRETDWKMELLCSFDKLEKINDDSMVFPKIMSVDGEMNSHCETAFPNKNHPDDVGFQIGVSVGQNQRFSPDNKYEKYLISTKKPDQKEVGDDVKIIYAKREDDVYIQFAKLIRDVNPNIIIGYNIFKFDYDYWIHRADMLGVLSEFLKCGIIKGKESTIGKGKWKSSAFGMQEMRFLDSSGRLYFDIYLYATRSYKLMDYRLSTVAEFMKVGSKDPLKPRDIFRYYKEGTPEKMGKIGKYCVQDSHVVLLIWEKAYIWISIAEEANACCVPIHWLYTRGQQIRMLAQTYAKCTKDDTVVQNDGYIPKEDEKYVGAYVIDPIVGKHDKVLPLDFASLYPSIMIGYNTDFGTLCKDEKPKIRGNVDELLAIKEDAGDEILDSECNVLEWEEHVNCIHDVKRIAEDEKKRKRLEDREKKKKEKEEKKVISDAKKREKNEKKRAADIFRDRQMKNFKHDLLDDDEREQVEEKEKKEEKVEKESTVDEEKAKELLKKEKTSIVLRPDSDEGKAKKRVICGKYRYRFIKAVYGGLGVLPTLETELLANRKKTKNEMTKAEEKAAFLERFVAAAKSIKNKLDCGELKTGKKTKIVYEEKEYKESPIEKETYQQKVERIQRQQDFELKEYEKKLVHNINNGWKMEKIDEEIERLTTEKLKWEILVITLNKRQLALKVCANSIYGATGATKGYLPMLPIAMSVTYLGRCALVKSIELAKSKFGATVIYGDTDSMMIKAPTTITTYVGLFEWARQISAATRTIFPSPMSLEFEEKIYWIFFILSKKRYGVLEADKSGTIPLYNGQPKINFKGIPLARRDNCKFMQELYRYTLEEGVFDLSSIKDAVKANGGKAIKIDNISETNVELKNKEHFAKVTNHIIGLINKLFSFGYKYNDFTIVKGITKEDKEYKTKTLPAAVQLKNRMASRGIIIGTNARLRYILTTTGGNKTTAKQADKIEEEEYFEEHRDILRVDFLFYLDKQSVKPVDQLLSVVFKEFEIARSGFMKAQLKARRMKQELTKRIEELGAPNLVFVDNGLVLEEKESLRSKEKKSRKKILS